MIEITRLMHKAVITLTVPLSLVISLLLALSAVASLFNPAQAEFMPLLGLFFPVFFLLALLSLAALAILRNRFAFLPLFILLAVAPLATRYVGKNTVGSGNNHKIITFNVHGFRGVGHETGQSETALKIAALLRENQADILCIQEFRSWSGNIAADVKDFADATGLDYSSYSIYWPKAQSASDVHVIISRFLILRSGPVSSKTHRNIAHFSDIATDKGNIRIVSTHLVSFSLDNNEISMLGQGDWLDREHVRRYAPKLSGKLTSTFRIRTIEIDDLLNFTNKSALPLVLAGDFNDTPASHTYRKLRQAGFVDAHPRNGRGIGATYAGRIPLLRIDYIFLSPAFEAGKSEVIRTRLSDHYPVALTFGKRKTLEN